MDIIKTREQLNLLINGLIDGYIENEKSTGEFMTKRSKEIKDYTQNMESLINEIKQKDKTIGEKDDEIRNINKTKHEYELMINKLNEKIVELETEENQKNKHDMIKVQAKELDEKDRVIEQLQNKILKLKGDPKSCVEKQLNEYNDMIDEPEKKQSDEPEQEQLDEQPEEQEQEQSDKVDELEQEQSGELEQEQSGEPEQEQSGEPEQEQSGEPEQEQPGEPEQEQPDETDEQSSEEDEEVWIKVKNKGIKYIVVQNQEPQYLYEITDNETKGKKVGVRTKSETKGSGKIKYKYQLD
jgi:chromosome segregation ATPase